MPLTSFLSITLSILFLTSPRVIPEYCKLEEADISEHAFDLIFAFDEIVALGYRESVNLAQVSSQLMFGSVLS